MEEKLSINLSNHFFERISSLDSFRENKYLLAVSGGVDSMVLLELFIQNKLNFSVAHCNYRLREKDSDLDEDLVRKICKQNKITCFTKTFKVKEYKNKHSVSTQMAARELRYKWFNELKKAHHFNWIVTAHHLDDQIETFIINLSRGSGLSGFSGILNRENNILRPLLEFTKEQILQYGNDNEIEWREDLSNQTNIYLRNKVRNEILPKLYELNGNFSQNFLESTNFLRDNERLIQFYIQNLIKELFIQKNEHQEISIDELKKLNPLSTHLYYLFKEFDFQNPEELEKFLGSNTGAEIQSKSYRLIKNRETLLLKPISNSKRNKIIINSLSDFYEKFKMKAIIEDNESFNSIDFDSIQFPLTIRKRKNGDYFYPTGMKGKKKISKYFKDEKMSKLEKENIWLLCNDKDEIIWVIGKRFNRKFIPNKKTKKFLNLQLC